MGSLSLRKWDSRVRRLNQSTQPQRQKCYPLEPVLEHSVARLDYHAANRKQSQRGDEGVRELRGKSRKGSIMARLRDGYVRLMNDMAASADLTGVSAAYGCSAEPVDASAMAFARRAKAEEKEAEEIVLAEKLGAFPTSQKRI